MTVFPFQSFDDGVVLVDMDEGETLTYGDLHRLADSFRHLERSLVFLFTQNHWREVATYCALIQAGHVVCLLDAALDPELKKVLVSRYRPHLIATLGEETSLLAPLYEERKQGYLLQILHRREESPELHPALVLLLSTSGTTGSPKMIRLSKDNLLSNARSIIEYLGIGPEERALASLPIHYSYGLSILHSHLLAGAMILLTRTSIMQAPFWQRAKEQRATSFSGVPYTYTLLDRFEALDLPTLRTMTQAGGALSKELVLKFHALMQQRGGRFFVMYGQTEATARIAYLPPDALPEKAGAIGKAIPGCTLKIYEGEEQILEPFKSGELVCEGSNVMLGYASSAEDLKEGNLLKGVLRTGDLAYFDQEGFFTISGRLKRISKVYGYRINLDELESLLRPIATVAATSNDHEIVLHIENGTQDLCEQCIKLVADKYHLHYATFRCRSVTSLPRTAAGKIDYPQLEHS